MVICSKQEISWLEKKHSEPPWPTLNDLRVVFQEELVQIFWNECSKAGIGQSWNETKNNKKSSEQHMVNKLGARWHQAIT